MFDLLVGAIVVVVVDAGKYRKRDGNKYGTTIETRGTHDKRQGTIELGHC
jgi:hypothetical protein